jgi:hypothetical protein
LVHLRGLVGGGCSLLGGVDCVPEVVSLDCVSPDDSLLDCGGGVCCAFSHHLRGCHFGGSDCFGGEFGWESFEDLADRFHFGLVVGVGHAQRLPDSRPMSRKNLFIFSSATRKLPAHSDLP